MKSIALGTLAVLLVAAPASAAPEMTADVGVGGVVAADVAFELVATVTSDVLWTGELVVDTGSLAMVTPVEIPAGTTKEVSVEVPPVPADSTIRAILRSDGDNVADVRIQVAPDGDGAPIALFGVEGTLARVVESAQMAPSGTNPTIVAVSTDELAGLGAFPYLVVGRSIPADSVAAVEAWVDAGGRLVGDVGLVGDFARGPTSAIEGAEVTVVGEGEVIVVDADADSSVWDRVLRDPGDPMAMGNSGEFGSTYAALQNAAIGSSGSPLSPLPFVLPILGVYILLVGPVNLVVLGRLGRRQWAWVTIPGLSAMAIAALWVLGPSRQDVDVYAATVVTDAGTTATRHMSLALMSSGDAEVGVSADGSLAGVGPRRQTVSVADGVATVGLGTGEPTGVHVTAAEESVSISGGPEDWSVTNETDHTFTIWGILDGSTVRVGSDLAPGSDGTADRQTQAFEDPWQPILMNVFWEFPVPAGREDAMWRIYQPLLAAGIGLTPDIREGTWFFGLDTDDSEVVVVDGDRRTVDAVTLVLHRLGQTETEAATRPALVAFDGLTRERFNGGGPGIFWGQGHVDLAYTVPPGTDALRIEQSQQFGPRPDALFYDYRSGDWVEASFGLNPDASRFVGPTGDVYVRLDSNGDGEIWPQGVTVEAAS